MAQILMVGDAGGTKRLVCEMLDRHRTIRLVWVPSVADARTRIRAIDPDAILLDLPLSSEVVRGELKALRDLAGDIPVIALTDRENRAAVVSHLRVLFDDYLLPACVDSKSLVRAILRQLPPGRQLRDLVSDDPA